MRIFSLLILSVLLCSPASAYYGRNSIEANLSFTAEIDILWKNGKPSLEELNGTGEIHDQVRKVVHDQILYLDGVFHSEKFAEKWGGPASCGPWYEPGNYSVNFVGVSPGTTRDRLKLKYEFSSKIVVQKDPLRRKPSAKMEVWLPMQPDRIYGQSIKWNKNQCTDREDDSRDSYYYFFDPFMEKCPLLKEHPESIQWITAKVERLENTRYTYPEYGELYKDDATDGKTLDIAMFWGYIAHHMKRGHPLYRDESFQAMKFVAQQLRDLGFEEVESHPSFRINTKGELIEKGTNSMLKLKKLVKKDGRELTIRVLLLLSDSDIHAKDPTFRTYVVPALNRADVFVYDGHSGDGDNLNPEKIGLPKPSPEKYQLFFINGCDSYMNYMQKFVKARGGLDKLDLVLSSTPTSSGTGASNDWTFIEPFVQLKTLTYQSMLDKLEKSNGPDEGTFLVGVIGDEKNTWKPEKP